MLVEVTSVEQLVDTLKKGKFRSSQEIRQKSKTLIKSQSFVTDVLFLSVVESMTEDDDIVAGPQKMSLKCPVRKFELTSGSGL
jgi:E3 SUMO-protein ligase PIAS1